MSQAQIVRRIVLPQAVVRMLPAFGSLCRSRSRIRRSPRDRGARIHAAVGNRAGTDVPADRGLHVRDAGYFLMLFPVTRGVELVYRRVAHLGRS
jgi:polar amino acid transport system permease protein